MMNIVLNGEDKQVSDHSTIEQLLKILNLDNKRLAVEINLEIIPRSEFSSRTLNEADRIEIVQAIGGGSHSQYF